MKEILMKNNLEELSKQLRRFVEERDWSKFHNPKNLSMSLIVESAELVEIFQWKTANESKKLDAGTIDKVKDEVADILIYLVRICDVLEIDLLESAFHKINKNRSKYPINLVRGSAKKYSELASDKKEDS